VFVFLWGLSKIRNCLLRARLLKHHDSGTRATQELDVEPIALRKSLCKIVLTRMGEGWKRISVNPIVNVSLLC
jgi:hypothetical protein